MHRSLVSFMYDYPYWRTEPMKHKKGELRRVLASNLDRLMLSRPGLETQLHLAKRSGVAQSTVGRILRAETSATLDNLEALADALGTDAAALLHSGAFRPASELPDASHLPDEEKARIAAFIGFTVAEYAKRNPDRLSMIEERETPAHAQAQLHRAASRAPSQSGNYGSQQTFPVTRRQRGRPRKRVA